MAGEPLDNLKHEAFAVEYTVDFNGTQAAIRAGYAKGSAHVTASRLLKNAKVLARIQERMAELTMSANEALYRLTQQARGDLGEYLLLNVSELANHPQSHLLHKVKRTIRTIPSKDKDTPSETEEKIELELYDAQSALALILKEQHLKAGEATDIVDVDDSKAREARDKIERALARIAERNRAT